MNQTQGFVEAFVDELLNAPEFANMTEETRNEYTPQLVAEAERRIGLAVLPLLNEAGAEEFTRILQSEDPQPADMAQFLNTHVPHIDEVMQKDAEEFLQKSSKLFLANHKSYCMPVSLADELQQREEYATERLDALAAAYEAFITEWNAIEAKELDALEALHDHVDKKQLQSILEHITHLNE